MLHISLSLSKTTLLSQYVLKSIIKMKVFCVLILSLHVAFSVDNFSTKTSYDDSLKIDSTENFFQKFFVDPSCLHVKHVTAIYRHGSRYPSAKDVKRAMAVLEKLKATGEKGKNAAARLRSVLDKFNLKEEKVLSASGFKELEDIGKQLKAKHPGLFKEFNSGDFVYYVTEKSRTVDSFKGFVAGIRPNSYYIPTPLENNYLLRFFDVCKKYEDEVDKNKSAIVEATIFKDRYHATINQEMAKQYKDLFKPYNLTTDDIKSLFGLAGTEKAVFGTREWEQSFWNDEAAVLMEYASDLSNYWKKAGGHDINYLQSCVLLKHLFNHFDRVVRSSSKVKGSFYFAHAETNLPLYAILGLFPDRLTSQNYLSMKHRAFKTTRIIPFAGNLRFEILTCHGGVPHISLYMKDSQLAWPACQNSTCPYAQIRNYYEPLIAGCQFDKLCHNDINPPTNTSC